MKLNSLPEAEQDLDRLFHFLDDLDPLAAQGAMAAIGKRLELLLDEPEIGVRMTGHEFYRQTVIRFGKSAYVLRYRIDPAADTLAVVRVWYGRENRDM